MALLDDIPVAGDKRPEEIFKAMIYDSDIWVPILSALHPQSTLMEHPNVLTATNALQQLSSPLQRSKLPVSFFLDMKGEDLRRLAKLCALASSLDPEVTEKKPDDWMADFSKDRATAQSFCDQFARLQKTILFLEAVTKNIMVISDAQLIISEVNKRKKVKTTIILGVAAHASYWGSLRSLIDSGKAIEWAQESVVFTNIARLCMKEEVAVSQTQVEVVASDSEDLQESKEDGRTERTAAEILGLLKSKGLPKLEEACTNLFATDKDLSFQEVQMLFNGIADEIALKKELKVIRSFFPTSASQRKVKMLLNVLYFPRISAKAEQLMSVFAALGYEGTGNGNSVTKALEEVISSAHNTDITLTRLSEVIEDTTVAIVDRKLDENLTTIFTTLQESSELISFMKETAGEDIRILIDAVEEHSDQFVSEATVSDLIDVHGFLRTFLREEPKDPLMLLDTVEKCYSKLEKKVEMAAKIKECGCNVHSLRGLYMNVANRGEMTKEIISNAVQKGCYLIMASSNGSYDVQLSYRRQEGDSKETSYNMAELHDLRSRALLIVNTDKKQEKQRQSDNSDATVASLNMSLSTFIQQVQKITDILNMVMSLRESGHPQFNDTFWHKLSSFEDTLSLANSLEAKLKEWRNVMHVLQKEHYFLNFFHPDQLWMLRKFFSRPLSRTKAGVSLRNRVHSLLRFVDPSVRHKDLDEFHRLYKQPKENTGRENDLRAVGEVLDAIFVSRHTSEVQKARPNNQQSAVKPGELFVAVLEENSKQTAHVVMSLFEQTTGSYPQPSQILFCHSETSWEEVERLLKRAFEAHEHSTAVKLHCLANVENLSNDMQFELVSAIRAYQEMTDGAYLLSIVCCGGIHHHIADQFSSCAHNDTGMTENQLRIAFQKDFPDIFMVTSDLPGVGKTEFIHEHAASKNKKVLTIPISGPVSRKSLVKMLCGLTFAKYECIHFDVGEVNDPSVLDTLIFELVIVGMVSAGTDLFHLPTKHVYIEIANTLRHWLQDSLPVTKCFSPKHIKLDGYKDLVVSQEPFSAVQVVCQYLHAFECGKLESKEVCPADLKPLSPNRCKELLSKHFSSSGDLSYNIIESFVKVFANQLMQFSASPYFRPHNLRAVLGPSHDVRNCLFKALLEVSREFASRSVVTCKSVQSEAISKEKAVEVLKKIQSQSGNVAEKMVERVEGMIQWADNNHLVIVFHSLEALTISALYRDLALVPSNVRALFKTQAAKGKSMVDFTKMNQKELQQRLDRIVRTTPREKDHSLQNLGYALTPDNILKMVLIIQRIRAGIPVIVMGETGCGKTSLVRYLAKTCGVPFHVFNFHAGVSEEELVRFVHKMEKEAASAKEVWVFLDEINTCDYLGTINEMICHRSIKGKPLSSNLVFMAACNPYRLRPSGKITTAGLNGKTISDEFSKLVYRVHPLPETMIDFVWDYGSLSENDERAYICRMVEGITGNPNNLLVDLLCTSQDYIRDVDKSPYCVSLRDVHRCIVLVKWFKKILQQRQELPLSKKQDSHKYYDEARTFSIRERSFVLALAHCFQSRLPTTSSRKRYCQHIVGCFRSHGNYSFNNFSFEAIVRAEQEDYLERMELPEGTAKNAALRENVFVMLVCILNRIPVFVVGKPGCSKSLSMQVIRSNLRGKDAKDSFLKTLPQLYVVSHQGSESSTSDGILKVFEKAKKYKEHNKSGDVLPVVLLDEIGLAEVSKYNPLKVLHSLLEPGDSIFPDVAVVGISNWALDAAKMNRAIHLSRPEPDVDDLFETGKSLREAGSGISDSGVSCTRSGRPFRQGAYPDDKQLRCLAEAYQKYQAEQRYPNFHGLRDYYSLIKCLSTDTNGEFTQTFYEEKTKEIQRALQRNFGGVPNEVNNFQSLFQERIQLQELVDQNYQFAVTDLICDNLSDKRARHLMIITNGDSAIGILDQTLQDLDKEKITIFGSRFEEDLSEEYNYRMLSRIILCMERDCVLILRDLESIYGSLYDMLNQNYTVVGGKRNCRVALGAFSNPMCQVHDGFRCVVLIDQGRVDFTDPPFLNRFEKQLLRFSDVLNEKQRKIIKILKEWVKHISTIPDLESQFHEEDMFIGFCDDTLPSLVLKNSRDPKLESHEIVEECKRGLMMIASPDGVVRSVQSVLAQTNLEEVQMLYNDYFQKPLHNGLRDYLGHSLECLQLDCNGEDASKGMRLVIMTHSNIHVNVPQCLDGLIQCQTEKLSAFKSEKQLTKELERFWGSSDSLLVLQCKPELDASHVLLAKSIIEQQRETYIKQEIDKNQRQVKHVCIVIHVQRESEANKAENQRWQFSFQSGWKQVTIDVLEDTVLPVTECLDVSVMELLESKTLPFEEVASNQFLWCFFRIKYSPSVQPPWDDILHLEDRLRSSTKILACFKELVNRWLAKRGAFDSHEEDRPSWQYFVACDRQALINSSHLVGAIQHHVSHLIRQPLAKIVYFLEKESAWPWFLFQQDTLHEEELQVWLQLIMDRDIFDIDDIPDHQGAESYFISERRVQLKFPYFSVFYKNVEHVQSIFVEDQRQLLLDETNLNENDEMSDAVVEAQLHRFASVVKEKVSHVFELDYLRTRIECYVEDFLDMKSAHFSNLLSRGERIDFLKSAMANDVKFSINGDPALLVTRLHSLFWLNEPSYVAALQVFVTCYKIANVEFGGIVSEFTPLFEKMLFQENNAVKNEPMEDSQQLERNHSFDVHHSEDACAMVESSEVDVVEVNSETFTTENETRLEKEQNDDEMNAVRDIGSQIEEGKEGAIETENQGFQEPKDEDVTQTTGRNDSVKENSESGVCELESVGGENDVTVEHKGNTELELKQAVEGSPRENGQIDNSVMAKDDIPRWRVKHEDVVEDSNVDNNDTIGEEVISEQLIAENLEENAATNDESEEGRIGTVTDDSGVDGSVSFNEVLLETLCSALLPTDVVVKNLKGPEGWQRTASLFLSTASRMQVQIPAFHYLRVCHDFVTLLVLPESLEPYSLYMLGALGKTGASEGYLDSPDIFDRITNVIDELEQRGVKKRRLEDFLMLFYGRCIDSNPDTPVLGIILAKISSSGATALLRLAGPLLHRIFLTEENFSPGVFQVLLHSLDSINDHPGLQETSAALSTLPDDVELDSRFAVVCCDLISDVAFPEVDLTTMSHSEDQVLTNFRKAFQTLTEPCEDTEHGSFHLLCATAYMRSFLASFAKFILARRHCLTEKGEFTVLLNEMNAALSCNHLDPVSSRAVELQLYFLKELKKELYMCEVRDICQRSPKLPALKNLDWHDDDLVGKLSFDPLRNYTENSQAQAAVATLLEKNDLKPLEDTILAMSSSAEKRIEMAATLAKSFYLVRSTRPLKDSEDKAIDSFIGKLENFENPYVQLLLRITGKKDFKSQKLCISSESSPADVHRATLILHLCIVLASHFSGLKQKKLSFMSYLTSPLASSNTYVLASGEDYQQPYEVHRNYSSFDETSFFFCSCRTFFVAASDDDGDETKCPNCRSLCKAEKVPSKNTAAVEAIQQSKVPVCLTCPQDLSIHVRQMDPREFRVLHLFVHAALYGGYAMELFDKNSLTQILGNAVTESDPCEVCFQQIDNDLRALCLLLDAKEEYVIGFLHCALLKSISILTSGRLCQTEGERLAWENTFAETVRPLLREFYPRKLLTSLQDFMSKSTVSVQRRIEEIDDPQFSNTAERNLHLPRLLRVTLPKTFSSLKAYYMSADHDTKNHHPLLGLFLDFNDSLPNVASLHDLLSWSRIVDSLLSRRLSRHEATTNIGDIIRRESPEERKRLSEIFEKFSMAWERMRPFVRDRLNQEVPYLSESSPISFCLIEKRGQGAFLCAAIEVLREIQNDFLQKMLSVASTGKCSALVFLEREEGKFAIPVVHLQEAREKEIIQYQWTDDILRHSQRNTEYGHGREIFFDLAKIEKEMAVSFLVGKSYLSTLEGLQEFIFARELFHTCRGILDDLQELIPQQPLTDVFRSSLYRQCEQSLKNVQDLLEHMEIVLCLLKRHRVGKPEVPLTEFTDNWLRGPRPFPKDLLPQPHSTIQLTHVVALYEFLEDMLAESAAKRVHDMYRLPIPEDIANEMTKGTPASGTTESHRSVITAINVALKRFIYRYLSSEEMKPEPADSLKERMQERSLWPIDAFKSWNPKVESPAKFISVVFPEKLAIKHTYQVLCFYQDRLKVSDEKCTFH